MISIILGFIIAIWVLVFVHELGHFTMAKLTGCRVDEFAVGFKPAIWQKKFKGTNYVLGLIPIGGYVKIWGENGSEEVAQDQDNPQAFYNRPRPAQALVLLGGVVFNFILAWLCFSLLLIGGLEVSQAQFPDQELADSSVRIVSVLDELPAGEAGIEVGSELLYIESSSDRLADDFTLQEAEEFIGQHASESITLALSLPEGETQQYTLQTQEYEGKQIIGIQMDSIGTLTLPLYQALLAGAEMTWDFSITILWFLGEFIGDIFTGDADAETVAGPVGIANFAGESFSAGFNDFVWFIAVLSLNLAIFNLLPIPALDGGRLVFVAIESVLRRPIDPTWFYWIHAGGFALLLLLMAVVTVWDIFKFF